MKLRPIAFLLASIITQISIAGTDYKAGAIVRSYVDNNEVIGEFKPYIKRHGNSFFPTVLPAEISRTIHTLSKDTPTPWDESQEYGWLDLNTLKQEISEKGITKLALINADILNNFNHVKICIGYEDNKGPYDKFPVEEDKINQIRPVYFEFTGWKNINGLKYFDQLDPNFISFIEFIEKETGKEIISISSSLSPSAKIIPRPTS